VLTAFIIESMKLLQEDPAETTRDILLIISQQIANSSLPPYQSANYQTPQYAVVVNGLFFVSLSCGLVVALVAVLALQWVANYDIGLNTSSPRKRALQRHLRWSGIEKWKMAEIIAFLPLLIFISLFLFFIGIADWLWHMNRAISGIVVGGIGVGCLLYTITTLISAVAIDAPFRTPVSKGLSLLLREAKGLFFNFPVAVIKGSREWQGSPWSRIQSLWKVHLDKRSSLAKNFPKQEDLLSNGKKDALMKCLLWLANSIEISPNSQLQLMVLIRQLVEVPADLLIQREKMIDAPWEAIFTTLSSPYINRPVEEWTGDEVQNAIDICRGMSLIPMTIDTGSALDVFVFSINQLKIPLASSISSFTLARLGYSPKFRDTLMHAIKPNVISELGENYLYYVLLTIQLNWNDPFVYGGREPVVEYISQLCAIPTDIVRNVTPITPFRIPSLTVILNLVAHLNDFETSIYPRKGMRTVVEEYISVARRLIEEEPEGIVYRVHRSMQQQLLAQISRVDLLSRSVENDLKVLVGFLLQFSSCKILALAGKERNSFISILARIFNKTLQISVVEWLWDGLRATYEADGTLEDQFVAVVTAFDDYLKSDDVRTEEDYGYLWSVMLILDGATRHTSDFISWNDKSSPWNELTQIEDPCLAWWLLQWSPKDWQFQSLIRPDFNLLEDRVDNLAFPLVLTPGGRVRDSAVTFVRTLVIDGSPRMRDLAIYILENQAGPPNRRYEWLIPMVSLFSLVSPLYYSLYIDVSILLCTRVGPAIRALCGI
jgi:hypothetical protein